MTMPPQKKILTLKGVIDGDPYTGHVYMRRDEDGRNVEIEEVISSNFHDGAKVEIVITEV